MEPYMTYYKRQIKSYNNTAHNILKSDSDLILPEIPENKNVVSFYHSFKLHRVSL